MIARNLFVVDTCAIVSFFGSVFEEGGSLSRRAMRIISSAFAFGSSVRLSIPSIVFVELYDGWSLDEEEATRVFTNVFIPISECPNIEIRGLDEEVLATALTLRDDLVNLENHDKIILSSAMVLECPVITIDSKIADYNKRHTVVPEIIG